MLLLLFTTLFATSLLYLFFKPFLDTFFYAVPDEPKYVHSFNPFFGFANQLVNDPINFISTLYQRYGKAFAIQMATKRYVYLCDEQTYLTKVLKSADLSIEEFLADFMVRGLEVSKEPTRNETLQQFQMKQYHQYLTGEELETLNQSVHDSLLESMRLDAKENPSNVKNFFDLFSEFLLFAGTAGLFGHAFANKQRQSNPSFYRLFQDFDHAYKLGVISVPFRRWIYRETFKNRHEFIRRFESLTLNNGESKLIYAREELFRSDEYKDLFREYDIAAFQASLLWAAVANTAPLSCWVVVDLLLHPAALEAVKDELKEHRSSSLQLYNREFLHKLKILESCIYETLRRISNAVSTRQAIENTTVECVDKTKIGLRKGDMLIYPAFLKHFDTNLFGPNPSEYQYDRFVKKSKAPSVMIFGCGAHMCPGRFWAINEVKMLVALIVEHMEIHFVQMTETDRQAFRKKLPYDYTKFLSSGGPKKGYEHKFDISYSYRSLPVI